MLHRTIFTHRAAVFNCELLMVEVPRTFWPTSGGVSHDVVMSWDTVEGAIYPDSCVATRTVTCLLNDLLCLYRLTVLLHCHHVTKWAWCDWPDVGLISRGMPISAFRFWATWKCFIWIVDLLSLHLNLSYLIEATWSLIIIFFLNLKFWGCVCERWKLKKNKFRGKKHQHL